MGREGGEAKDGSGSKRCFYIGKVKGMDLTGTKVNYRSSIRKGNNGSGDEL